MIGLTRLGYTFLSSTNCSQSPYYTNHPIWIRIRQDYGMNKIRLYFFILNQLFPISLLHQSPHPENLSILEILMLTINEDNRQPTPRMIALQLKQAIASILKPLIIVN